MLEIRECVDKLLVRSHQLLLAPAPSKPVIKPGLASKFKSEGWEKPSIFDIGDLSA